MIEFWFTNRVYFKQEVVTEENQESISQGIADVTTSQGSVLSSNDIVDVSGVVNNVIDLGTISQTTLDNLINTVDGVQTFSRRDELKEGNTGQSVRKATVASSLAVAVKADEDIILITKDSIG